MMRLNLLPIEIKTCTRCKETKTIDDFSPYRKVKSGLSSWCKLCTNTYIREWRNTPTGKKLSEATQKRYWKSFDKRDIARLGFARKLKESYGIDVENWARMYNAQDGKCLGCTKALAFDRNTHVDHCHSTGQVRGLLCGGCNNTLGQAKDNPETLRRLALYVETSK